MIRLLARRLIEFALATILLEPVACDAAAIVGKAQRVPLVVEAPSDSKSEFRQPDRIPFPADDLYTAEKARLGRTLYFDPRLSRSGAQSCSSCHNPAFSFGDGLGKGVGDGMMALGRRSPSLVNVAWNDSLTWDGRYDTLEAQALAPIETLAEMNLSVEDVVERLKSIDGYGALFAAAFPGRPIGGPTIGRALATFERGIVSAAAPFDDWIAGDENAISDEAKRGFAIFTGKARCAACHAGWNFTDNGFHDIGLPGEDDLGRGALFPNVVKLRHAFKTPSLREIGLRAPYMHDGSLPTLESVVAHYNSGGVPRPSRSELVAPIGLTQPEAAAIVEFLRTLSGPMPPVAPPILPR